MKVDYGGLPPFNTATPLCHWIKPTHRSGNRDDANCWVKSDLSKCTDSARPYCISAFRIVTAYGVTKLLRVTMLLNVAWPQGKCKMVGGGGGSGGWGGEGQKNFK